MVIGFALMVALAAAPVHAVHSTYTTIKIEDGDATIRIRTFADDFSASVARFAGREVPRDYSAPAPDVDRYVAAHFRVMSADGTALRLQSCGLGRERDAYRLCFRVSTRASIRALRIRNLMLTELHADQINIVQVEVDGARRTHLFTKDSPAATP
jgi:hypothetical protein